MVDFQPQSATHLLVNTADDWNPLLDHALEKGAAYIVRKNGSYYEAILGGGNTGAGTILFGGAANAGSINGTNGVAVVQAALNGLTVGRTWKEKVVLKGTFNVVTDPISVPSWTILDLSSADIVGTDINSQGDLVDVRGTVGTPLHDIDIIGGYLRDNAPGLENCGVGITNAHDIFVFGVGGGSLDFDVITSQENSQRLTIQNCYSTGTRRGGFSLMDGITDSQIIGCRSYNDVDKGIYVSDGTAPSNNIIIADNIVIGYGSGNNHGIMIQCSNVAASNNIIRNCGRNGYNVLAATNVSITGGCSNDNLFYGIDFAATATDCSVVGVNLLDNTLGPCIPQTNIVTSCVGYLAGGIGISEPVRVLGAANIYQNTTTKTLTAYIHVAVALDANPATNFITFLLGTVTPPNYTVGILSNSTVSQYLSFTLSVPPGWYYSTTVTGTVTLSKWMETV